MAILGHPFYAGGHDMTVGRPDFAALRQLLREHDVAVVMAGDTHDLEYYAEPQDGDSAKPATNVVHHFVNGGGGAYLSFGTALAWPEQPATADWAYYPAKAQVVAKIEATTPLWKRPAWWWTTRLNGWPFSTEWLSAAFDVNVAPFYQSFMEVRVEPSARPRSAHSLWSPRPPALVRPRRLAERRTCRGAGNARGVGGADPQMSGPTLGVVVSAEWNGHSREVSRPRRPSRCSTEPIKSKLRTK